MMADIIAVNGGKNGINRSYFRNENCAFCSVAYEMRRRGNNVRAQESIQGVTDPAIQKSVKNLKQTDVHDYAQRKTRRDAMNGMTAKEFDEMSESILKDGPNSRGQVTVDWKCDIYGMSPGGHAFNYEVKDGTLFLVDAQVGKAYSGRDAYNYLSNAVNVKTYRTDDKKMDTSITEKYYTEVDTGRIKNETKAQKVANAAVAVSSVAGIATWFGLKTFAVSGGASLPSAIVAVGGAATSVTSGVVGGVAGAVASKNKEKKYESIREEWKKDNRSDFYSMQDKKTGKKEKRT